ncbi:phosphatidic acid phosphatase type 2/haloperoxidase [Mycena sanguinolenta]|nr:phosphatidic acid phosphatase type 2/haloperoxidase [Mycena sanguinolenta]
MSSNPNAWTPPWWLSIFERTNLIVISLTAVGILWTRSAAVAYCGAMAVGCTLSVKVLKRGIRQPRPVLGRKKTYGMPSTHSASIAYFATFIPLACLYLPLHPSVPGGESARIVAPILTLPLAALIGISRVWLGHHTWAQVGAGLTYGVGWAFMCFALWTRGLNEYGEKLERVADELFGWR